jgi:hypothetical protein
MPTPRKHESPAARQRAYRQRVKEVRLAETKAKGLPDAPGIPTMPGKARWHAMVYQALALLWAAQGEIQSYMDDRSEAWQESQKAESLQEVKEAILEAFLCAEAIDI